MLLVNSEKITRINASAYEELIFMKKVLIGILITVISLVIVSTGVFAAPSTESTKEVGPYEGNFTGVVIGDQGSRAPLTLNLTHRGEIVNGSVSLGDGLYIDGGICGGVNVPSGRHSASGRSSMTNPEHLNAQSSLSIENFNITVNLASDVTAGGKFMTAKARVDLPWFCGKDPVINGYLIKSN
jgi:hypothetical protein